MVKSEFGIFLAINPIVKNDGEAHADELLHRIGRVVGFKREKDRKGRHRDSDSALGRSDLCIFERQPFTTDRVLKLILDHSLFKLVGEIVR